MHSISRSHQHYDHYHHITKGHLISEQGALYITHTLRFMGMSFVGVYLPVYIFELTSHIELFNTDIILNGIAWVALYYFLRALGSLLTTIIGTRFIFSKLSFRGSILLSFFVLVMEVFFWMLAKTNYIWLIVAGAISGIKVACYWIPYHISFIRKAQDNKSHRYGKKTSFRFFLVKIFSAIAPLIGGFVIQYYGFTVLFMIALGVLITAGIPMALFVNETKHSKHEPFKIYRDLNKLKNTKYLNYALFGEGVEALIVTTVWPIIVFITLTNFTEIGLLSTISLCISAVSVLLAGYLVDKYGTKGVHKVGVSIVAAIQSIRAFFFGPFITYFTDISVQLGGAFYAIPMLSKFYEYSKDSDLNETDYVIYRELVIHSVMAITSLALILYLIIGIPWKFLFIIAAIAAIISYQIENI